MAVDSPTVLTADLDPVTRLLAAGKCKQAVEFAKEQHKKLRTPGTERQLVTAYLGRIEQFQSKGMSRDADSLITLVQERFPAYQNQLMTLKIRAAAGSGRIDELLAPLSKPDISVEMKTTIEAVIRENVIDLPGLAGSAVLPADHPLRVAAAALHRAFEAVTTGPAKEAQLALPEVSFRSPLAGWKMLIRAIGALYRHDDAACRRSLESIPADSAVHRLVPALLGIIEQKSSTTGFLGALQARVTGDDAALLDSLRSIESSLDTFDSRRLANSIRNAVRLCAASHPELSDRLRQHVSVACAVHDVPVDLVLSAMTASRKNAYFWRLFAREVEADNRPVHAAIYWQRFLAHAVAEGLFTQQSLEAALVYRRVGTLLSSLPPDELETARVTSAGKSLVASYYEGQPKEIAALVPRSEHDIRNRELSLGWIYQRAVEFHPDAATFQQWWAWAETSKMQDKSKEEIARTWHGKLPGDAQPLLHLSVLAEDRNALTTAINHLTAAEKIDPLNPAVRRARLRLTLGIMHRHFREKKAHLVEKDLAELELLPGMRDGDRAVVLSAFRCAWQILRKDTAGEAECARTIVQHLGPIASRALLDSVVEMAKLPRREQWSEIPPVVLMEPREVARAQARLLTLAQDVGFKLYLPVAWNVLVNEVLAERPCPLSTDEILTIGEAAVRRSLLPQAYLASSAGLAVATNRATQSRSLLIRAGSLNSWWAESRAIQCLRAALELARQTHDAELINRIFVVIDQHPSARRALANRRSGEALADDVLADILKNEREASRFPKNREESLRYLVPVGAPPREVSPFEMFEDQEETDEDFIDDGDADFLDGIAGIDLSAMKNVPTELLNQLQKLAEKLGHFPTAEEMVRMNPMLMIQMLSAMSGGQFGADPEQILEILGSQENMPAPRKQRKKPPPLT